jgi:NhaP-type Na+/H+ or K+/H+ antiporter
MGLFAKYGGSFGQSILTFSNMSPSLILLTLLPPLIFDSAFNADWYTFKRQFSKIIILAGFSLIVSTYLTAVTMTYILGYSGNNFPWTAALLFGFMVSATDPVAVVSVMKEQGVSRKLAMIVEGESLMNDGTAMVGYLVVLVSDSWS